MESLDKIQSATEICHSWQYKLVRPSITIGSRVATTDLVNLFFRRAKDYDVTWLYGPQLNIETLSNARTTKSETPCGPSQLPLNMRPVIKKRTAFSVTSKIPPRSHLPVNAWATFQNDYLKLHGFQPLIRVPWRQSLLIQVVAILVWYTSELLKRIYSPLSSDDPVRVRFDREVQQCIAVEASISSNDVDEQNSGKSRLVAQNCTSRGRRECRDLTNCKPDCSSVFGVFHGRTIRQIEPTKLKFQEEVDDANMEDDIPLL